MQLASKLSFLVAVFLASPLGTVSEEVQANPLGKVLELIDQLSAKIQKDGELEAKAYHEYFEWCDDAAQNAQFAIETAAKEKVDLEAKTGKLTSDIEVATAKIAELAAAISTAEKELKEATVIRDKEAADFGASEKELMEAIDALDRAIGILEKDMNRNPASLAQVDTDNMASALRALSVVLDAAAFPSSDTRKLRAFVQSHQESAEGTESDDEAFGMPAAPNYKSHSGGIFEVLEDMKEKADGQLRELRKGEVETRHNYEMLKKSLQDQTAADTKDMDGEKTRKAEAEEGKATAEGDLAATTKDLVQSQKELETTKSTCLSVAADHEASVAARDEELNAIAEAKKVLRETTSGATSQTYSFLQVRAAASARVKRVHSEVLTMVKRLAKKHHSAALAQLASRIAALAKFGAASGDDPFAKIKGLLQDMISKLEKEAGADATEKAYCDEEMSKTEAKKTELDELTAKMTARIDQATSKSAQLKQEVQLLEGELAALTKEQAELDKIRQEAHEDYVTAKADLEQGLTGIRKALGVLRDYYAAGSEAAMIQDEAKFGAFMQQPTPPEKHSKSGGAGGSIIDILTMVESDFATNLAKEEAEEADAQSEYDKVSEENSVTKVAKEQDVNYKTQESKSLDKTIAELSSDRDTTSTELAAVLEYYDKVKGRCIAKPEAYAERAKRRVEEIEGLKVALATLANEAAFVQRKRRGRHMRGALAAR